MSAEEDWKLHSPEESIGLLLDRMLGGEAIAAGVSQDYGCLASKRDLSSEMEQPDSAKPSSDETHVGLGVWQLMLVLFCAFSLAPHEIFSIYTSYPTADRIILPSYLDTLSQASSVTNAMHVAQVAHVPLVAETGRWLLGGADEVEPLLMRCRLPATWEAGLAPQLSFLQLIAEFQWSQTSLEIDNPQVEAENGTVRVRLTDAPADTVWSMCTRRRLNWLARPARRNHSQPWQLGEDKLLSGRRAGKKQENGVESELVGPNTSTESARFEVREGIDGKETVQSSLTSGEPCLQGYVYSETQLSIVS
ncbi:unnamed protein product [Protopolystoma xenopodis]|uniref:Uncharacterized protein n=1 Tax=Protopolystoma xenopodis TaxID=117903 RepID=A0A448XHE2_9PLAT|nr:unnamed protein product [Protopolystoma xenopodis]